MTNRDFARGAGLFTMCDFEELENTLPTTVEKQATPGSKTNGKGTHISTMDASAGSPAMIPSTVLSLALLVFTML